MEPDALLAVYLHEYEKLKDEQIQRIGFRDNMIYITLVAAGAVGAFAVSKAGNLEALFIIPWVCFVLGWTYIVNDEKISAIGRYLRSTLDARLRAHLHVNDPILLQWEIAHRDDERRRERKRFQLFVDELTFVFSGLAGVVFYWLNQPVQNQPGGPGIWVLLSAVEGLLLLLLGIQMWRNADLARGG